MSLFGGVVLLIAGVGITLCLYAMVSIIFEFLSDGPVKIFNYEITKHDRITELEEQLREKEENTVTLSEDLLDRDNFKRLQGLHDEMQPVVDQILMSGVPMVNVMAYLLLQYHEEFFNNHFGKWVSRDCKKELREHCRKLLLRR